MKDLTDKIKEMQRSEEQYSEEGMERLREQMKNYEGEYKLVWWKELLERVNSKEKKPTHNTGISALDMALGGLREQQLATIVGDSGHGKTQMGLFLLEQMADLCPVMIPLEQSAEEIIEQRQDNGHSIPNILSPDNLASRTTTDWIEGRIVEGIAKFNTKLVLIDHLGYVDDKPENKNENIPYRIGENMRDLKGIAKRWNVIVIVLVHISQHDEGKPPMRKDIKNSSDIIQESDFGLFIWRKNEVYNKIRTYENKTLLSIQKNRKKGKHENIGLVFDEENGSYYEENSWVKSLEKTVEEEYDDI